MAPRSSPIWQLRRDRQHRLFHLPLHLADGHSHISDRIATTEAVFRAVFLYLPCSTHRRWRPFASALIPKFNLGDNQFQDLHGISEPLLIKSSGQADRTAFAPCGGCGAWDGANSSFATRNGKSCRSVRRSPRFMSRRLKADLHPDHQLAAAPIPAVQANVRPQIISCQSHTLQYTWIYQSLVYHLTNNAREGTKNEDRPVDRRHG